MTRVPDAPLTPWRAPAYDVSSAGKVSGATAREPNNWGRWGDDDQIGTANLVTPERIAAAATLIRTGKRFSLAVPIGVNVPSYRAIPLHLFTAAAGDAVLGDIAIPMPDGSHCSYSDDYLVIALQYTTQLDGFGFAHEDALYNGYWAGLVTARSGLRRLGMHHRARGIIGRAVVLDVARHLDVACLDDHFRIDVALLEATAAAEGIDVRGGDILLVRTGFVGTSLTSGRGLDVDAAPGLSASVIPWLVEHDIVMVGADNPAIEVTGNVEPGYRPNELHIKALRDLGLQLGETFDLDELAADCADDGVYESFFVAAPLPVVGGAGSPLNPIAIK